VPVSGGNAYAGIRFSTSGFFDIRDGTSVWTLDSTDAPLDGEMWIAGDAKDPDLFDPADYEARFSSVTGDTGLITGSARNTWIGVDSLPNWSVRTIGTNVQASVSGIIQVRKISDPTGTVRSGNLTLTATQGTP
jgi:hypothetical protein